MPDFDRRVKERWIHSSDGTELLVRVVEPQGEARARVGIVHGYGDHSGRYGEFMNWLAGRGVGCASFDFRGHGRSGGRRGYVTKWEEYLEDLAAFLGSEEMKKAGPRFLVGHSHGALVVAMGGIRGLLTSVEGVVLCAPYFRNRVPVAGYKLALNAVANRVIPWLPVKTGIRVEWLSRDEGMCEDRRCDSLALSAATPRWFSTMRVAQGEVLEKADRFTLPFLMLVAGEDPIAEASAQRVFFERAGATEKEVREYPGMVHEILREVGREKVYEDVLSWITRR